MRKVNKQSGTLTLHKLYSPVSDLFAYMSHGLNSALFFLFSHCFKLVNRITTMIIVKGRRLLFFYLILIICIRNDRVMTTSARIRYNLVARR